jgi:hypothetical protein
MPPLTKFYLTTPTMLLISSINARTITAAPKAHGAGLAKCQMTSMSAANAPTRKMNAKLMVKPSLTIE